MYGMLARLILVVFAVSVFFGAVRADAQRQPISTDTYRVEEARLGALDADATVVVSPDGRHVAYVAAKGNKQFVIVDGQAGREYDAIDPGSLVFSPDGKRLAYVAARKNRAATGGQTQFVVEGGKEGKGYDGIGLSSVRFSPDSKRVGYGARTGQKPLLVIDGQEHLGYDGIGQDSPVFSPDGRHVAYVAAKRNKQFVMGRSSH
jgi:Tol biopolymer transport system component